MKFVHLFLKNTKGVGLIIFFYGLLYLIGSIFSGYENYFGDFGCIYLGAKAFFDEKQSPYPFFPEHVLDGIYRVAKKVNYPCRPEIMGPFSYHPITLVLLFPLTFLPYRLASILFLLLNIAFFILFIKKIISNFSHNFVDLALLIGIIFLYYPTRDTFYRGQFHFFFFLLLLKMKKDKLINGILFGSILLIKPQFAYFLLPYFVLRRYWKLVLSSVLFYIGITGLCIVIFGYDLVYDFYSSTSVLSMGIYGTLQNQSLTSIIGKLKEGIFMTPGLFESANPTTVLVMRIAMVIGLFFMLLLLCFVRANKELEISFCILNGLIFAPFMWYHYMVFLLTFMPYFIYKKDISLSTLLFAFGIALSSFPPKIGPIWARGIQGLGGCVLVEIAVILLLLQSHIYKREM